MVYQNFSQLSKQSGMYLKHKQELLCCVYLQIIDEKEDKQDRLVDKQTVTGNLMQQTSPETTIGVII